MLGVFSPRFLSPRTQHLVITNTVAACEAYVLARRLGLGDTAKLKSLLGASWGHRSGKVGGGGGLEAAGPLLGG